jgi:hypothetical protein
MREHLLHDTKDFIDYYGLKFLVFISIIIHVFKGLMFGGGASGLIGTPFLFIMRDYKYLNASRIQILKGLSLLPWTLKPLFGLLSDIVSIFGYNKLYYMIFVSFISSVASFLIFFLWIDFLTPELLTLLFVFIYMSISVNDLLVEAKYTEKIKEKPEIASNTMIYVYGGLFIGELLSIVISGLIIEYNLKRVIYLVATTPLLIVIVPIWFNWINDTKRESKYPIYIDITKVKSNWKICVLSLIICILSITCGIIGFMKLEPIYYLIFSLSCGVILIILFNLLLDPIFAKIQSFFIIQNMFSVSIETASFFFFTDDANSYPDGPHFSQFFYITVIGIVGSLFGLIGMLTSKFLSNNIKYRGLFYITNLLYMAVNLLNIVIFNRWNLYLGIPDKIFILGAETFQHIISIWNNIPILILTSHLCQNGMEATTYALTAGTSNLGSLLSQYQGAFLLNLLKITPNGGINDFMVFDNLWLASFISALFPCLPLILINYLIPDKYVNEKIEDRVDEINY